MPIPFPAIRCSTGRILQPGVFPIRRFGALSGGSTVTIRGDRPYELRLVLEFSLITDIDAASILSVWHASHGGFREVLLPANALDGLDSDLAQQIPPNMTWYMDGVPEVTSVQPGWSRMQVGFIGRLAMYIVGTAGLTDNSTPAPCSTALIDQGGFMWTLRLNTPTWTQNTVGFPYEAHGTTTYSLDGQRIYSAFIYYPLVGLQNSALGYIVVTCCNKAGVVQWVRKMTPNVTSSAHLFSTATPLGVVITRSPSFGGEAFVFLLSQVDGSIIWQKSAGATGLRGVRYAPLNNVLVVADMVSLQPLWRRIDPATGSQTAVRQLTVTGSTGNGVQPYNFIEKSNGNLVLFASKTYDAQSLLMELPPDWSAYMVLKNFAVTGHNVDIRLGGLAPDGGLVLASINGVTPPGPATAVYKVTSGYGPSWSTVYDTNAPRFDLQVDSQGIVYFSGSFAGPMPLSAHGYTATFSADGSTALSGSAMESGTINSFSGSWTQGNYGTKTMHIPDNAWIGFSTGQNSPSLHNVVLCSGSISYPTASKTFSNGVGTARYQGACAPALQPTEGTMPTITDVAWPLSSPSATWTDTTFVAEDASSEIEWLLYSTVLP